MSKVPETTQSSNVFSMSDLFNELQLIVNHSVEHAVPAHEFEVATWEQLLRVGRALQSEFFSRQGDGDRGQELTLADGRRVRRLAKLHSRGYRSMFGEFELHR